MASYVTAKNYPNPWPGRRRSRTTAKPRTRREALASALAYWGEPGALRRIAAVHRRIRPDLPGRGGHRPVAAEPLPGDPPERAADADRDLPRHAGELTMAAELFVQRLHPLAAAARGRRPGRARAALDRAGHAAARPAPAWTGARSCCARPAAMLAVYGAAALSPRHLEDGHRPGGGRGAARTSRCSSRSSWKAAGTRSRCSRPSRKPSYHELRPTLGRSEGEGRAVHRGRNADVAPAGRRPRAAARRRQGDGVPGDRLRPAGREPLHQPPLLGGRRTQHPDALRLDGPLPRRRRRSRQPAPGPVARLLAGARAGDHAGARGGGLDALGLRLLGLRPGRTARPRRRWKRSARSARWRGALAGLRAGAHRLAGHQHHPHSRSRRSPNTKANRGFTSPVTYPTAGGDFPTRLAVLAAMLDDEALPIKCVSLNAVGSYDTHSDEGDHAEPPTSARPSNRCVAFQRDLEARRLDDRVVDPAVVGVRPPPAGKRLGHRPRRGRASRS